MKKISRAQLDKIKASGGKVYRAGDERPQVDRPTSAPDSRPRRIPSKQQDAFNTVQGAVSNWAKKQEPPAKERIDPEQALVALLESMTTAINAFTDIPKKPELQVIDGGLPDTGPVPQSHGQYAIDTVMDSRGLIDQIFLTDTSGNLAGTKQYQVERNEWGLATRIVGPDKVMIVDRDSNGQLTGLSPA